MWSDLAVASALARTAIEGGLANVQINLQELKDEAFKAEMQTAFAGIISGQESSGTQESSPAIDGAK